MADGNAGTQPHAVEPPGGVRVRRPFSILGLDALALILLSSYSVHRNWVGHDAVERVRSFVEISHTIQGFICVLILGSILSLDLRPLARMLPRVLIVIALASLIALLAGVLAGRLSGLAGDKALFLTVVPVLSGGLNAGVLPLALGYGVSFGDADATLAMLLPPLLLGNLMVVAFAGVLGQLERRRGAGKSRRQSLGESAGEAPRPVGVASAVVAIAFLAVSAAAASWLEATIGVSEPVSLLSLAGLLLTTDMLPRPIRHAVVAVYRFSAKVLVFPVLILSGLLYSPWGVLVAGFSLANLFVVTATVSSLCLAGYLLSLRVGLEPVDGSIIAASRAAMGGTGDIAMLSAARRLDLMPFAQIATRLGGAVTVFIALLAM